MNNNMNYIKQVAVLKMKSKETKKTFAVLDKMFPINENNNDKDVPYDWVSGASRLQFSIIEKTSQNTRVCDVNLSTDEINDLYDQTKSLYTIYISNKMNLYSKSNDNNVTESLCYTETFKCGTLKGKTPAEIADKDVLEKQKSFLETNIDKYPDNQKIIQAINDCLKKMEEGTLNSSNTNQKSFTTYELMNIQEKPRRAVKDRENNTLVTGIRIACNFSRRLPICVIITHYYAPVQTADDGRLVIQASKSINKQDVSVNLALKDWNMFITRCQKFIDRYENYLAPQMIELANKYSWKPNKSK